MEQYFRLVKYFLLCAVCVSGKPTDEAGTCHRFKKDIPGYDFYQQMDPDLVESRIGGRPNRMSNLFNHYDPLESREKEYDYNKIFESDRLWRIDNLPVKTPVVRFEKLPDIYVDDKDLPMPIVDNMAVEQSELTQETKDMGVVEFGEEHLEDPTRQMHEVILEGITAEQPSKSHSNIYFEPFENNFEYHTPHSDEEFYCNPNLHLNLNTSLLDVEDAPTFMSNALKKEVLPAELDTVLGDHPSEMEDSEECFVTILDTNSTTPKSFAETIPSEKPTNIQKVPEPCKKIIEDVTVEIEAEKNCDEEKKAKKKSSSKGKPSIHL